MSLLHLCVFLLWKIMVLLIQGQEERENTTSHIRELSKGKYENHWGGGGFIIKTLKKNCRELKNRKW